MKDRKILIAGSILIVLLCIFAGQCAVRFATVRQEKNFNDTDLKIQDIETVPQCLWGTWVMTEQWHGQYGWGECRNYPQGMTVRFTPTGFTFQDEYSEVSSYSCELVAIADVDGYYREIGRFRELGMEGDYFLAFYPIWDDWKEDIDSFGAYIPVSDTELVIPEARSGMYRMEKVEEYTETERDADYLRPNPFRSIYYGVWEITEALGEPCKSVSIGDILTTSECSFVSCRLLDREEKSVEEAAKLIGLGEGNALLVYCTFAEDYFWDYMIIKDGMTAVLVKEAFLYQIERISDPEEDDIYDELG